MALSTRDDERSAGRARKNCEGPGSVLSCIVFPCAADTFLLQRDVAKPESSVPPEWLTHAEKTNYRETPRYAQTIEYSKRLDQASSLIKFQSFGKSGEGRELPLLLATEGETFTPEAARQAGKAVILIQACIHAGEPDGKDAGSRCCEILRLQKRGRGYSKIW